MEKGSYFVIESWMSRKLGLSGNFLSVYALIYGFSRDGQSCYYGTYSYIKELTGITSDKTVTNVLNYLVKHKFLIKEERYASTGKSNGYKANLDILSCKEEPKVQVESKPKVEVDENGFTEQAKMALGLIPMDESVDVYVPDEEVNCHYCLGESQNLCNDCIHGQLPSYNQILDDFGVKDGAERSAIFEFIRHCQLNGRMVTNDKLERLIIDLDMLYRNNVNSKVNHIHNAIDKGYFSIK